MNPKKNKDWTPEPFPEPRTIPEGWNADAFSEKETTQERDEPVTEWKPDPFPKPRMFPWSSGR